MTSIKNCQRFALTVLASSLMLPLAACVVAQPEVVYRDAPPPPPPVVETDVVMDTASEPPPPLPVYEQPECPAPGYIWTPGYWAYAPAGYYWVPGTWVMPPRPAVLWTPGYWGWSDGVFLFHAGYWGPHVGFYGGVNYGYGYGGSGYEGGRWNNGVFNYNTSVNNVNVTNIHNTYNVTVVNNVTVNRVSYNGGNGGVSAMPTEREQAVMHEQHFQPTSDQLQHRQAASSNRALFASENHGAPAIAATPRPGAFNDHAIMPARQASFSPETGNGNGGSMPHQEGPNHQPPAEGGRPNFGEPNRGQAPQAQALQQPQPQQSHAPQQQGNPQRQNNQQWRRGAQQRPQQRPRPQRQAPRPERER